MGPTPTQKTAVRTGMSQPQSSASSSSRLFFTTHEHTQAGGAPPASTVLDDCVDDLMSYAFGPDEESDDEDDTSVASDTPSDTEQAVGTPSACDQFAGVSTLWHEQNCYNTEKESSGNPFAPGIYATMHHVDGQQKFGLIVDPGAAYGLIGEET